MWVLEQHWKCGISLLAKLKVGINEGFSWGLSKILKGGVMMGDETSLPVMCKSLSNLLLL